MSPTRRKDPDDNRDDFWDAREERDAGREDRFRCPECETNTGDGRTCLRCRIESGLDRLEATREDPTLTREHNTRHDEGGEA